MKKTANQKAKQLAKALQEFGLNTFIYEETIYPENKECQKVTICSIYDITNSNGDYYSFCFSQKTGDILTDKDF